MESFNENFFFDAWRNTSIITGVFIVLAAWKNSLSFINNSLPVDISLKATAKVPFCADNCVVILCLRFCIAVSGCAIKQEVKTSRQRLVSGIRPQGQDNF